MAIEQQINQDFLTAFKEKEAIKVSVLRMLKTALQNRKIEKMIDKATLMPDDDVIAVIKSEVKKRKDSITAYEAAKRDDLVEKEKSEVVVLEKYLPEQLSNDALREIVKQVKEEVGASGASDFGKLIGAVMKKTAGQADGQVVSALVKEVLQS